MTRIAAFLIAAAFGAAVNAQQITLRMGHDQPVGSMYDEGHRMFKKLLEERSKGRIKADIFPAAQLGSEVAMVEDLRQCAQRRRVRPGAWPVQRRVSIQGPRAL